MKKMLLAASLVFATSLQAPVAQANNEGAGTIIGGLVGGIIGHQFGKGGGKVAATIIGAGIGAIIGNEIGRDMDEQDRRIFMRERSRALRGERGHTYRWKGRNGYGEFTTVREGYDWENDAYCREYKTVTYYRGKKVIKKNVACEYEDGSWTETETTRVRWSR